MDGLIALDGSGSIVGARLVPSWPGIVGRRLADLWGFGDDDTAALVGIALRVDGFACEATLTTPDGFAVRRRCTFRHSGLPDSPLTLELEPTDGAGWGVGAPLPKPQASGSPPEPDSARPASAADSRGDGASRRAHRREPRADATAPPAFADALGIYLAALEVNNHHPTELKCKRGNLERFAREAGWVSVADITPAGITQARAALAGLSSGTVRKYLIRLSGFLDFCVEQQWLEANPAKLVRKPRHVKGSGMRALTTDEVESLTRTLTVGVGRGPIARARRHRAAYYAFAAWTGLRRSECARLRWAHVDEQANPPVLRLPASLTKSRKAQAVPLLPDALDALRMVREGSDATGPDDPVFAVVPGMRTFDRDLAHAGIPKLDERGRVAGIHSLRKHLGTALADAGADIYTAQAMLRHASIVTTRESYVDDGIMDLGEKAIAALTRANANR